LEVKKRSETRQGKSKITLIFWSKKKTLNKKKRKRKKKKEREKEKEKRGQNPKKRQTKKEETSSIEGTKKKCRKWCLTVRREKAQGG